MAALKKIRLKNLRCFSDTGSVEMKPITLLVGKNSAGKSTFARVLPLLRQSIEGDKRAPILWFGRLVDFGDFKTAVNWSAEDRTIEMSLTLELSKTQDIFSRMAVDSYYFHRDRSYSLRHNEDVTTTLKLESFGSASSTFASSICLELFGNRCEIFFSEPNKLSRIVVNEFVWELPEGLYSETTQELILPRIRFHRPAIRKFADGERKIFMRFDPFVLLLREAMYSAVAHKKTAPSEVDRIASSLPLGSDADILASLTTLSSTTKAFRQAATRLTLSDQRFIDLRNMLILAALPSLLDDLDRAFGQCFAGVRYVEPLRATAERYYRRQELAVDEIDSKGTNVAMFIDSLSDVMKSQLNEWLTRHFGISISAKSQGGHVALELQQAGSKRSSNLADLGFGFSQLLPIVLQLWQATKPFLRKGRRRTQSEHSTVVIEQPELHLHPAYQATLANVMVAAIDEAKAAGTSLSIVAETHSPHLVNRMGELVSERRLDASDVQVVLIDQLESKSEPSVKSSSFDSDGVLQDWPYGFFEPEVCIGS